MNEEDNQSKSSFSSSSDEDDDQTELVTINLKQQKNAKFKENVNRIRSDRINNNNNIDRWTKNRIRVVCWLLLIVGFSLWCIEEYNAVYPSSPTPASSNENLNVDSDVKVNVAETKLATSNLRSSSPSTTTQSNTQSTTFITPSSTPSITPSPNSDSNSDSDSNSRPIFTPSPAAIASPIFTPSPTEHTSTAAPITVKPTSTVPICNAKFAFRDEKQPNTNQYIWYTPIDYNSILPKIKPGRCSETNACFGKWKDWCEMDDGSNQAPPTKTPASPGKTYERAKLCLNGNFYGRNSNRMITVANCIRYSQNGIVRIGPNWSAWFLTWFDPAKTSAVHLSTDTSDDGSDCQSVGSFEMYYKYSGPKPHNDRGAINPGLYKMFFKPSFMNEAKKILAAYANEKGETVTVHSRWLEGECKQRQQTGNTFCAPDHRYGFAYSCEYTESYIQSHVPVVYKNTPIVLCADKQHAITENTFKTIDSHSYQIQFSMMIASTYHFGNPASSVDYVVAHMRHGKKQSPEQCYDKIIQGGQNQGGV